MISHHSLPFLLLLLLPSAHTFLSPLTPLPRRPPTLLHATTNTPQSTSTPSQETTPSKLQSRPLGSQELLMLPRQYSPSNTTFPPLSHVSAAILSRTPTLPRLRSSLHQLSQKHPLLRAKVEGSGEPLKRIDLFQMVREGNPDPETFVIQDTIDLDQVPLTVHTSQTLEEWQNRFEYWLDRAPSVDDNEVLWRVELVKTPEERECALLFGFNHAISDQSSANLVLDHLVSILSEDAKAEAVEHDLPQSMEDCMLASNAYKDVGIQAFSIDTLKYVWGKAIEGFQTPVSIPDTIAESSEEGAPGCAGRRSTVQFRTVDADTTLRLLQTCRKQGVSVTNALSAAMTLISSDFIGTKNDKRRNYKVLLSLDMRRFQQDEDKCETLGCHAASMDLMYGNVKDGSGRDGVRLWELAREGKRQMKEFLVGNGPEEAVKVFDFGMTISDMNNLVHMTAMDAKGMGRAYSAGVTNNGVFERQKATRRVGMEERENLKTKHGNYEILDVFYATSHARSGCLYQLSCLTINDELKLTFHPAYPPVSPETNRNFADSFVQLLQTITNEETSSPTNSIPTPPSNALSLIAAGTGLYGLAIHADGWSTFFANLNEMYRNVPFDQFVPALQFWIFFAVGHPVLQPVLYLSDVLHSSPGFLVGGLVPITFVLGNLAVLTTLTVSKEIRNAVNVLLVSAMLTYIGAGLDGTAGLGDYNLQLNDSYKGNVVKGCPAYNDMRQSSMDGFDLEKYQGKWYEHKFHDWTQFKEVYDTTLDIQLTSDGKGWTDDFAVKGPSPKSAPESWDKSPVANGAHYFLFGRVDPNDPPGVLRESGFGVEFPNYIVDVQKDPKTGEYTEAIQFQCLERGGVRVFEGINYLSRKPQMSNDELKAMHMRAERAGMNPYGASEDQMHVVERRIEEEDVDNAWQKMWKLIGVDQLLELLTESIEDGGR